jgi:hypothetical protein
MRRVPLGYEPTDRQKVFHSQPERFRLYGGAAGGGKSLGIVMEAFMQALQFPKLQVCLFRKTFPELEVSLIREMHLSVPKDLYHYNESKHTAVLPNDSLIKFSHLEHAKSIFEHQGAQYGAIGFDELTHFTFDEWTYLRTRNRSKIAWHRSNMFAATNPGGVGHAWVKSLWIDKKPAPGMDAAHYLPEQYSFTPAKITDNPHLLEADPEYLAELDRLPPALRAALREGSWDMFAGQYFDNFSPNRHVGAAPTNAQGVIEIPRHWPKWIAIDWGFAHDFDIQYVTYTGKKFITYREQTGNKLTGRQIGQLIVETLRKFNEEPDHVFLSHDAFAKKTDEMTVAIQIGDELVAANFVRPTMCDRDRIGGWALMYDLLREDRWMIDRSCTRLIETIPLMIRDPKETEDCVKMDGDDPADCARYSLKTRARDVGIPRDEQIAEMLKHIPIDDLTSRSIFYQGAANRVIEASRPMRFGRYGRVRQEAA